MIELREYIKARGWTQAEAADFFGETQPRISNLLKGEISRFSIDRLINMLARAGLQVSLETKQAAAEQLYDPADLGAYQEVSAKIKKASGTHWSSVDSAKARRMLGFKPNHVWQDHLKEGQRTTRLARADHSR